MAANPSTDEYVGRCMDIVTFSSTGAGFAKQDQTFSPESHVVVSMPFDIPLLSNERGVDTRGFWGEIRDNFTKALGFSLKNEWVGGSSNIADIMLSKDPRHEEIEKILRDSKTLKDVEKALCNDDFAFSKEEAEVLFSTRFSREPIRKTSYVLSAHLKKEDAGIDPFPSIEKTIVENFVSSAEPLMGREIAMKWAHLLKNSAPSQREYSKDKQGSQMLRDARKMFLARAFLPLQAPYIASLSDAMKDDVSTERVFTFLLNMAFDESFTKTLLKMESANIFNVKAMPVSPFPIRGLYPSIRGLSRDDDRKESWGKDSFLFDIPCVLYRYAWPLAKAFERYMKEGGLRAVFQQPNRQRGRDESSENKGKKAYSDPYKMSELYQNTFLIPASNHNDAVIKAKALEEVCRGIFGESPLIPDRLDGTEELFAILSSQKAQDGFHKAVNSRIGKILAECDPERKLDERRREQEASMNLEERAFAYPDRKSLFLFIKGTPTKDQGEKITKFAQDNGLEIFSDFNKKFQYTGMHFSSNAPEMGSWYHRYVLARTLSKEVLGIDDPLAGYPDADKGLRLEVSFRPGNSEKGETPFVCLKIPKVMNETSDLSDEEIAADDPVSSALIQITDSIAEHNMRMRKKKKGDGENEFNVALRPKSAEKEKYTETWGIPIVGPDIEKGKAEATAFLQNLFHSVAVDHPGIIREDVSAKKLKGTVCIGWWDKKERDNDKIGLEADVFASRMFSPFIAENYFEPSDRTSSQNAYRNNDHCESDEIPDYSEAYESFEEEIIQSR